MFVLFILVAVYNEIMKRVNFRGNEFVTFTYFDGYFNIRQVRQIFSDYFNNTDDEHHKVII